MCLSNTTFYMFYYHSIHQFKMAQSLRILLFTILASLSSPCLAIGWFGNDLSGHPCVGGGQGIGPLDYTSSSDRHNGPTFSQVEGAHFTPSVENLIEGHRGTLAGDLDYTLRAIPNHHRALYSVIRYGLEYKKNTLKTPPECYLQRAIAFKPDDAVVHMLFGIYLQRKNKYSLALEQYQRAEKLAPDFPELHYNLGLLYFELKKYEMALGQARQAYSKGYPLPGLKNKLKKLGVWQNTDGRTK